MHVKAPADLRAFDDCDTLSGIRIIPTPGHTPGHVCFLYDSVLFAGDLVEHKKGRLIPYPAPWNWDQKKMAAAIKAAAAETFSYICPAHGKPLAADGQRLLLTLMA